MLPKQKRVKRSSFPYVMKEGKSFHSENLSLKVAPLQNKEESIFSFVVSKKVSKKANERNLLKRRGYNSVNKITKKIKKGFVCVIFFKKKAIDLSYSDIEKEISNILNKANILK